MVKTNDGYEVKVAYMMVEGDTDETLFKDPQDERVYEYYHLILRAIQEMAKRRDRPVILKSEDSNTSEDEKENLYQNLRNKRKAEFAPYQFVSVTDKEIEKMTSDFSHMVGKKWATVTIPNALINLEVTEEILDYINRNLPTNHIFPYDEPFSVLNF